MKILFVYTLSRKKIFDDEQISFGEIDANKPIDYLKSIHFGISYLASHVEGFGHEVELFVYTSETKIEKYKQYVEKFNPDVICLTSVEREFALVKKIAIITKEFYPNVFILGGGTYLTLNYQENIKYFNAICVGEGEEIIIRVLNCIENKNDLKDIPNLILPNFVSNDKTFFIQNLDNLSYPNRKMWHKWTKDLSFQGILLSRGCPYSCTYCSNHALKKISDGKYTRFRTVENIISEMEHIKANYPETKSIFFESEMINVNVDFITELCFQLKGSPINFGTNIRIVPKQDYKTILKNMRNSNFKFLALGLESGSEKIRSSVLKRKYLNDDFLNLTKEIKNNGIFLYLYVLMGIPGETEKDFQETVDLVKKINPNYVDLAIFSPYSGTSLYKTCLERKLINKERNLINERVESSIELPEFPSNKIKEKYKSFYNEANIDIPLIALKKLNKILEINGVYENE